MFVCFVVMSMISLVVILAILKDPFSIFKKKLRQVPPACLTDSSLGNHKYITVNSLKFHCVINGDPSKKVMLFLHGFPEFWFSWRYQIREFCHDYHVVAVDMRGYGQTEKPVRLCDYDFGILIEDVVQLVKVLSPDRKCILVCHDWGGVIGWSAVDSHPELFDKCIVMNAPHIRIYNQAMTEDLATLYHSWYFLLFQSPLLPEMILSMHDFNMLDILFRGKRMGVCHHEHFSDEVVEAYKFTFSENGAFTYPLNYYRNMMKIKTTRNHQLIEVPILLIWGDNDGALSGSLADRHEQICTHITIKHIPDCSHWVQQDCPELTNQYMREFLAHEF